MTTVMRKIGEPKIMKAFVRGATLENNEEESHGIA
jgi:hypothetical protein